MKTTYLKEYQGKKIVYLPVGTYEWHGNHLPLETDVIVAETLAQEVSKKIPGVVMPGIWLATDRFDEDKRGMERHVGKKLPGEIYFLQPELWADTLTATVKNLVGDGFKRIVMITGHAGSKNTEVLKGIEKKNEKVIFINPYESLKTDDLHAGVGETSLFWACRPEEEAISRALEIPNKDDYFTWLGYDPRERASITQGQELLDTMVKDIVSLLR